MGIEEWGVKGVKFRLRGSIGNRFRVRGSVGNRFRVKGSVGNKLRVWGVLKILPTSLNQWPALHYPLTTARGEAIRY